MMHEPFHNAPIQKPKKVAKSKKPMAILTINKDVSTLDVDGLIRLLNWIKKIHRDLDSEPKNYGKVRFRLF